LERRAGVFAGIRNLFDEDYWGKFREEGIILRWPRNTTAVSNLLLKTFHKFVATGQWPVFFGAVLMSRVIAHRPWLQRGT